MRPSSAIALVAAILALTGCAAAAEGAQPPTPTPSTSTNGQGPTLPDLEQFTPPPEGLIDEDTGEAVTVQPVPEWNQASRSSAIAAAEQAMTAFARPSLDYDTWWAELVPLLTQQATADYAYVDPGNIPASRVTGSGELVEVTSAYVANVEVPTDAGTYTLVLSRANAAAPWLASRFTPPTAP